MKEDLILKFHFNKYLLKVGLRFFQRFYMQHWYKYYIKNVKHSWFS
jgi:hypothetical protein